MLVFAWEVTNSYVLECYNIIINNMILYSLNLYSYTHIATHYINNSYDFHSTGGQLFQNVDLTIIPYSFLYFTLLLLQ